MSSPALASRPTRVDGPFSAPHLLQRATPFIGAAVLATSLTGMQSLTPTHVAALVLSVLLIVSAAWREPWKLLPRAVLPLPAAAALALTGLPLVGSPVSNPVQYLSLAVAIGAPFSMDSIPWRRLPRWGESLALLVSVSPILFSSPPTHSAAMLLLPLVDIIVLFVALYGSRLELIASVALVALLFGLPEVGKPFSLAEVTWTVVLTSMTAIVAVCVFQVVALMRRQQWTIIEDHRQSAVRERWIQSVLENTADGLVTIDVSGSIISINRAARNMFGYDSVELAGQPISVFIASAGQGDFAAYLASRMSDVDDGLGSGDRETTGIRRDRAEFPIEYSAGQTELDGSRVFIVSLRDITDRRLKSELLERQALHDGLTGLPNRTLLEDRVQQGLAVARRGEHGLALMMLDFDHFKSVNDRWGHDVGDRLLCEVSARISSALRASDTLARLGGDEFVVLATGAISADEARRLAAKIVEVASRPLVIDGHQLSPAISIGIALYPEHGDNAQSLLLHADQAMYIAKRAAHDLTSTAIRK